MVVLLKIIGVLGFISGILSAFLEPRLAVESIVTAIASCIGCFFAAELLDTLHQIRDNTEAIKGNTKKETEKKTVSTSYAPSYSGRPFKGWTCQKCGTSNPTTASFCKDCGKDR